MNGSPIPDLGPIWDDIAADYAGIEAHNQAVSTLKEKIERRALDLSKVADRYERLRIAHALYWRTEAPGWAITAGLLFDDLSAEEHLEKARELSQNGGRLQAMMRRMIGAGFSVPCETDGCEGRHLILSRSGLIDHERRQRGTCRIYRDFLCPDCKDRKEKARFISPEESAERSRIARERYEKQRANDDAEFAELKSLSSLSEEQLVRLYEIMSRIHGRSWAE